MFVNIFRILANLFGPRLIGGSDDGPEKDRTESTLQYLCDLHYLCVLHYLCDL
jgi:hypothetical protein